MSQTNPKPLPQADILGHRTRFSDSSLYDEVCELCGTTDGHGGRLNVVCPQARPDTVAEMAHYLRDHADNDYHEKAESTKKLLRAAADYIEELGARKLDVALTTNVTVDVGEALLKGKTPEEQEEMRQGFAQWFDIQRANTKSAVMPKKSVIFFIDGVEVYRAKDAENISDIIKFVAPRDGVLTWVYETGGVEVHLTHDYQRNVVRGDIINLSDFKPDLVRLKTSGVLGSDPSLNQHAKDQADALDFGVTYKAVKMAREAYEGEQAKTHLCFMADWNKLARFRRRDLSRARM